MRAAAVLLMLWVGAFLAGCGRTEDAAPPPPGEPIAHHVLIVSIDGCRPDVLLRAQMEAQSRGRHPMIMELMQEGSFTFWAQTIPESITLPSHTSMLTGVSPAVHGITWNDPQDPTKIVYSAAPTLFEVAKRKGLTTAIFAGKEKFFCLAQPGTIDWGFINKDRDPNEWVDDATLAETAAKTIREHKPNVTFLHLGLTDGIGHSQFMFEGKRYIDPDRGWGSEMQLRAVEIADQCVRIVVQALKDAKIYDDTLIIISADHGGAGISHGPDDPRSRHIPWICVGPRVRKNYDLTRSQNVAHNLKTQDTFATACFYLGLPVRPNVVGRPILEMIEDQELLQAK